MCEIHPWESRVAVVSDLLNGAWGFIRHVGTVCSPLVDVQVLPRFLLLQTRLLGIPSVSLHDQSQICLEYLARLVIVAGDST